MYDVIINSCFFEKYVIVIVYIVGAAILASWYPKAFVSASVIGRYESEAACKDRRHIAGFLAESENTRKTAATGRF